MINYIDYIVNYIDYKGKMPALGPFSWYDVLTMMINYIDST